MDKNERAFWRAAILIFIFFVGLFYFPVVFGRVPFPTEMALQFPAWAGRPQPAPWSYGDIGDLVTFFYPARAFIAQSVKQGVLPLWNPLLLSGEPFLAITQSSLFYPLNVLYYLLPVATAWTVSLIVRLFLAALFMTMFVRSIGGSKTGSIFAGIVFGASGWMTAWQGQPIGDGAIWLPFVCWAIHNLRKTPSASYFVLTAAAFAMPVLAGHPEMAAHVTLTGAALALMLWMFPPQSNTPRFDLRFPLIFTFAGLLAVGLASVQIIPTIEWLRQTGTAFRWVWPSLAPHQVLGWVSRDVFRSPNSAGINIPESVAYMAVISILAAPLALFHRSRFYVAFLSGITACAVAVAYGVQPIHALVSHIPVLWALKNSRLVLVATFGMAGLAGLGMSALEEQTQYTPKNRVIALGLVGSMFALTFALIHRLQLTTSFKPEFVHRPSFSRTLLIISLILVIWKLYGGLRGQAFALAVCSLAIFDLWTFGFGFTGFVKRDDIFPSSPVFEFFARQNMSQFRIIEIGLPYPANAHTMYNVAAAEGYEVRLPELQRAFASDTMVDSDGLYFTAQGILESRDRRLDLLNVKYVVLIAYAAEFKSFEKSDRFVQVFNNGDVAIFENKSALPRAWLVPASGIEIVPSVEAQLRRLKDQTFDPNKSVILPEMPARVRGAAETTKEPFQARAEIIESGINHVKLRTESSAAAVLVISQTHYPGWRASVDGDKMDVVPTNLTLTGVPVPAGAHEVRVVFEPLSFRVGLALSILSIIILLATLVAGRKRRIY
jgi:hypothetical protein